MAFSRSFRCYLLDTPPPARIGFVARKGISNSIYYLDNANNQTGAARQLRKPFNDLIHQMEN